MSSRTDYSSCFEQNNSFIVNKIHESNKNDKVPEFFELLKYVEKKNCKKLYKKAQDEDDIAHVTECNPYPETVMDAIRKAKHRVELQALIPIEHYSCTVDNKLLIWPIENSTTNTDNKDNVKTLEENCELITCVGCGASDQITSQEKVTHIIVIATNRNIIIYPVLDRNHICYISNPPRTSLKTCIVTSMAISDKGKIFLGTDLGDIFLVTYSLSKFNMEECNIYIEKLATYRIFSYLKLEYIQRLIPVRFSNIIQLSLCPLQDDSIYIASLDTKNRIIFYHYTYKGKQNKLTEISRFVYNKKKMVPEISDIKKIISVPISDSKLTRFIAFTKDGDRLFFDTKIVNEKNENTIYLQQIRHFPDLKEEIIDASYSLGVTCFMCRKHFYIAQTTQKAHVANVNPIEIYNEYEIPTTGLVFSRNGHIFSNQPFHIFNNEMLWQHLINSSPGYLMTTGGSIIITFSLPVDRLSRLLNESHGKYNSNIIKWMNEFDNGNESSACTLLLASQRAESERSNVLFVLYSYTMLKIEHEYPKSDKKENHNDQRNDILSNKFNDFDGGYKMPESCAAFVIRAARLMKPIWDATIFKPTKFKGEDRYRIHTIYDQLPQNFLKKLENLIDLAHGYLKLKKQTREEGIQLHETIILKKFINYMQTVIETITFIQILNEQQKHDGFTLLTDAMKLIEKQYQHILLDVSFGKSNENHIQQTEISLFESLHEFAAALFKVSSDLQSLQQQFNEKCPDFFNDDDSQIFDELNRIEKMAANTSTEREEILKKARDVFVKFAHRPLKLQKICEIFEKYYFYEGIVDVCIKRAYFLDPEQLALQWLKNGCQNNDMKGDEAFNKRHGCYEFIFRIEDLQNAFDSLLETNDEVYHICLYRYLIYELKNTGKYTSDEIEELLTRLFSKTTQYLEDYLKEKAPQNLWKYQARHQNYGLAARLLLEIIKDEKDKSFKFVKISENEGKNIDLNDEGEIDENSEIPDLKKRTAYLLKVISFSRGCGDILLLNEAQWLYRLASIQLRYNEKINELILNNPSENLKFDGQKHHILDHQTLFNICSKHGFWDLVLELFSFCAIRTDNKEMSISRIWTNYLFENLGKNNFNSVRHQIVTLINNIHNNAYLSGTGKGTRIEAENDILKSSTVLPLLEEFKYNNKGPLMWACDTLLNCGINPESLFIQYTLMIRDKEPIEANKKADFVYIIAQLVTRNYNQTNADRWKLNLFNNGMDWFIKNAINVSFYNDCYSLINKIKNLL